MECVNGLEELIRPTIKMLFPTTVAQAAKQARLHELSMETFARRHRLSYKNNREEHNIGGFHRGSTSQWQRGGPVGKTIQPIVQPKNLSVDQKRQLGLCFCCGEKYG